MLSEQVIYVDCDGVLSDFAAPAVDLLNEFEETAPSVYMVDELGSHDEITTLARDAGHLDRWAERICEQGWCANLAEFSHTDDLCHVIGLCSNVHILTTPFKGSSVWHAERVAWLVERGVREDQVIFAKDKSLFRGSMIVEDNLDTVRKFLTANTDARALVVDRPWSRLNDVRRLHSRARVVFDSEQLMGTMLEVLRPQLRRETEMHADLNNAMSRIFGRWGVAWER